MREHAVQKFGANSTPTFFINDETIAGNHPLPVFDRVIEKQLNINFGK